VDGFGADHARNVLFAHPDRLTGEVAGIDATYGLEAEVAALIVMGDDEASLVHVGSQQDAQTVLALAAFGRQDITQGVDAGLVHVWANLLQDNLAHLALITGDSAGVRQAFQ